MRWLAPLDRREITLILFSLCTYFLAFNFETSLRLLGIDPLASQGAFFRKIGLGKTKLIGNDGRKPQGWRDALETEIFGDWRWDENHIAGDGEERSQSSGNGRHGATWIGSQAAGDLLGEVFGNITVDQALQVWGEDIPQTKVVKHVPGYTILDNVMIFNGSVYLVTEDEKSFPPMASMVATVGNGFAEWKFLSKPQALAHVGDYGSIIRGVSWMQADSDPHNSTLFALWRLYSTLDTSIDYNGLTHLPPPQRMLFPHNRFFTDANPDFSKHWLRRVRVDTGFHPYLAKAAFPHLTMLYYEDWEDYHKMVVPFFFERLVVADRQAAGLSVNSEQPTFSPPFDLEASKNWWEPVRRTLALNFDAYDEKAKDKKVITYLHRQSESTGPKLVSEDHDALVRALQKLGRSRGYVVHVVSTSTTETDWSVKMGAVVRSSVILGVHGNHLFDCVFMKPSPQATLMEFFPADTFAHDRELTAHSLGFHYVAWQGNQEFTSENLPKPSPPSDGPVHVDADAVIQAVQKALSHA